MTKLLIFKVSGLEGKIAVLLVSDGPVVESAVICEYLEDTLVPRLDPADALRRAQHRAGVPLFRRVRGHRRGRLV